MLFRHQINSSWLWNIVLGNITIIISGDLGRLLSRQKRISEDHARIYVSEVLLALQDLHKRDIIYRDLKPDNVVLNANGHALLTDFGLSKSGIDGNFSAKSFCGSYAYLAPEMLRKTGHGKSVDWYLLGVLLYELIVGKPPYYVNDREKYFKNIQVGPLKVPDFISPDCKSLLVALLNRNPTKRLGGGKLDAEEVKGHPWFKDINWDDVINKRLKPPKPKISSKPKPCSLYDIFEEFETTYEPIPKWDYKDKSIT